jgi:ribosomal protein L33
MSQDHLVGLTCTKCKKLGHRTTRNKKKVPEKLKLFKFCKVCRSSQEHKESKV